MTGHCRLSWASGHGTTRRLCRGSKKCERFFATLKKFDDYLASKEPVHASLEKVFQGPVADALTHVGQIGILRRLAHAPVKGESYYEAEIEKGRVGADQTKPKREF